MTVDELLNRCYLWKSGGCGSYTVHVLIEDKENGIQYGLPANDYGISIKAKTVTIMHEIDHGDEPTFRPDELH